jgi:hypothetical protein
VDAVARAITSGSYPRVRAVAAVRRVLRLKRTVNAPGNPTSLAPANGATASVTPTLSGLLHDPVPGTDTATFYVRTAGSSSWDVANGAAVRSAAGTRASYALPTGRLLPGTSYEWRMRACNDAGLCSPVTPVLRFTTLAPAPSPSPSETATATATVAL